MVFFETSHRRAPNYFKQLYTNIFSNIIITLAPKAKRWYNKTRNDMNDAIHNFRVSNKIMLIHNNKVNKLNSCSKLLIYFLIILLINNTSTI